MEENIDSRVVFGYDLPLELIHEILSRVPTRDLFRFKCVSRPWYNILKDPTFTKLQVARTLVKEANSTTTLMIECCHHKLFTFHAPYDDKEDDPDLTELSGPDLSRYSPFDDDLGCLSLVGSCHGLLCFIHVVSTRFLDRERKDQYLIYNPTTRTRKVLPRFPRECTRNHVLGFGYDSVSNDYKILTIYDCYKFSTSTWIQKSMLYSLNADAWEIIGNPTWDSSSIDIFESFESPVLANNSFHWLHRDCADNIKCFSLTTREYYEIPIPERILSRPENLCKNRARVITSFGGCLCVVTSYFDIWMLKDCWNNKTWTQLFRNNKSLPMVYTYTSHSISIGSRGACFKDGHNNIFILSDQGAWFYCNVAAGRIWKLEMPDFPETHSVQPWVVSLVPLQ